jgi:hypothetical protein
MTGELFALQRLTGKPNLVATSLDPRPQYSPEGLLKLGTLNLGTIVVRNLQRHGDESLDRVQEELPRRSQVHAAPNLDLSRPEGRNEPKQTQAAEPGRNSIELRQVAKAIVDRANAGGRQSDTDLKVREQEK